MSDTTWPSLDKALFTMSCNKLMVIIEFGPCRRMVYISMSVFPVSDLL